VIISNYNTRFYCRKYF